MFSDNNSKTFTIKDYTFGNGTPRICVPVIGRTDEEIMSHAKVIRAELDRLDAKYPDREDLKVAVIEWRSDFYNDVATPEKVTAILEKLRETFEDRLLLFTFRSEEQGGELRHDRVGTHLENVYKNVIMSGLVDLVDVEAVVGNYNIARATTGAHKGGVGVILSYHDFYKTPHDMDIEEKLRQMDILGGDILKIAVMPKNEFDTRRLMELNKKVVAERYKPVALISMGDIGVISRVKGKETGSALTFASIGMESAPGQMEADDLIAMLANQ